MGREPLKLRKLPLWGVTNVSDADINFVWPNPEALKNLGMKQIPELQSISFWFKDTNTVCLRGVQFTHTNNVKSPLYETGDVTQCQVKVEQPALKNTTAVSACCRETQRDSIKSIMFTGPMGTLFEVNHYKREIGLQLPTYQLGPEEEIIGGYGVSNRQRFITSFGFMVMKRPN